MPEQPRFSIVMPTYNRRSRVAASVCALDDQTLHDFEVIVAVDGSTDGSAAELHGLTTSFSLTVVEQANAGPAAARNAGAAAATGKVLVFLDDDMRADPQLLAEYERSLRGGADVVMGNIPLDPAAPDTMFSRGVATWASQRADQFHGEKAISAAEMLSGNIGMRRELFESVGGFDSEINRGGLMGWEDFEFGARLLEAGAHVVFNRDAISYQYYETRAADVLRRSHESGWVREVNLDRVPYLAQVAPSSTSCRSLLARLVAACPRIVRGGLCRLACLLADQGRAEDAFNVMRHAEYLRGGIEARASLNRPVLVLAFHAISDLSSDPVLAEYGISRSRFEEHLDALRDDGWEFVRLDDVLNRQPMPTKPVLITFDDCYVDLLTDAAPALAERRIPAVAFAVTGKFGSANDWDRPLGARTMQLLDPEGLAKLADFGIELGGHSHTHRKLGELDIAFVRDEVSAGIDSFAAHGLPRPRAFAYPHGSTSLAAANEVRAAGYQVAFTTRPGKMTRRSDPMRVPRIEVLASDTPSRLRARIATAAVPTRVRRRLPWWR
jgi:GT2 family glycosyltransferase/peptidoglycan/xylan/chitin deacetylase (PgdA/CDA1 family)